MFRMCVHAGRQLIRTVQRHASALVRRSHTRSHNRSKDAKNLKALLKNPTSGQAVTSKVPFTLVAQHIGNMNTSRLSRASHLRLNAIARILFDQLLLSLRKQTGKTLYQVFDALPATMPYSSKLVMIEHQMTANPRPPRPVITGHQTMVFSNKTLHRLHKLAEFLLQFDDLEEITDDDRRLIRIELDGFIRRYLFKSMLPTSPPTPADEAERDVFIQMNALKSLVGFLNDFSNYIAKKENRTPEEVKEKLLTFFPELAVLGSWVPGDAEGNDMITPETMSKAIPNLQIGRVKTYIADLTHIIDELNDNGFAAQAEQLENTLNYLKRLLHALKNGVIFKEEEIALRREKRIKDPLAVIHDDTTLPNTIRKKADDLKTLIQLAGLMGNTACYLRRSVEEYGNALDDIISLFSTMKNDDITPLMKDASGNIMKFTALPITTRKKVLKLLDTELKYFIHIRIHKDLLSETTIKEIDRVYYVRENSNVFKKSIVAQSSDATDHVTRLLGNLGGYLDGTKDVTHLNMDQMRNHIALPIPLCETPETILLVPKITDDMLSDPDIRRIIVKHGVHKRVGGPSDLGTLGGLLTRLDLVNARRKEAGVFQEKQILYKKLRNVAIEILHGFGADLWRRISGLHRHQTLQGYGAYIALGAPHAYQRWLECVLAQVDPIDTMSQQLDDLERLHPHLYRLLFKIKTLSVDFYQTHMASPPMQTLLDESTTHEVVEAANTSSRRSARTGKVKAGAARAIGQANHWTTTGHAHVMLSLYGAIGKLSKKEVAPLPLLLETQWILRDIFHTMMESMVMSSSKYAWKNVLSRTPTPEEIQRWRQQYADGKKRNTLSTMAYNEVAFLDVLKFMTLFLPPKEQEACARFIADHEGKLYRGLHLDELALHLMAHMGPRFKEHQAELSQRQPLKKQFFRALWEYKNDPTPENRETAVLTKRAPARNLIHGSFFMESARYQTPPGSDVEQESSSVATLSSK